MISFTDYLIQKKIDGHRFKATEAEKYQEFEKIFEQVHPNSFTIQKLNLINLIRRRYPLQIQPPIADSSLSLPGEPIKPASTSKVVFKRK